MSTHHLKKSVSIAKPSQKGQATLEFVIILPLIGLFMLLIAYAGWWTYLKLSAQNAAYSGGIFMPRERYGLAGNTLAQQLTIHADEGMKQLWGSSTVDIYTHKEYGWTRQGGSGMTVNISALAWKDFWEIFQSEGGANTPRGTAFFMYSPFMSAGSEDGWITPGTLSP